MSPSLNPVAFLWFVGCGVWLWLWLRLYLCFWLRLWSRLRFLVVVGVFCCFLLLFFVVFMLFCCFWLVLPVFSHHFSPHPHIACFSCLILLAPRACLHLAACLSSQFRVSTFCSPSLASFVVCVCSSCWLFVLAPRACFSCLLFVLAFRA